ncbi:Hpt domain-containing protein [Methylorubrum populi]|uniref:Hpt domain-containing protein n=1 Tax=Methylorubrum populi TaxID=223967 RepID=A0A160PKI7_9HYPH|nr:Hpt domain-containing protein [Methylorubrum populi]BAU93555.1 Hpt domain-containing protein [Methylorubrum populi]
MDAENQPVLLLDRAHLDAQTFGDADLAREVLSLFEDQCRRLLPALAEAGRPAEARADLAHTLKGAALGVGAMRVAQASAAVEAGFRSGAGADLSSLQAAAAETLTALATFGLEA